MTDRPLLTPRSFQKFLEEPKAGGPCPFCESTSWSLMITDDDDAAVSQTLLRVVDHPERGAVIDFYGCTCDKRGVFREHRRNIIDAWLDSQATAAEGE